MSDSYLEIERQIIGLSLTDETHFSDCASLAPIDFSNETHKTVWSALREKYTDVIGLCERVPSLAANLPYLIQAVQDAHISANVKYYCEVLKNRAAVVNITSELTKAITQHAHASDIDGLLAKVQASVSLRPISTGFFHIDPILKSSLDGIEYRFKNKDKKTGIRIGIDSFDDRTGGLKGGDLWVIAARPSMGKTALAMTIAKNHTAMDENANVQIFSLEMQKEALTDRLISSIGRIDSNKIRDGNLDGDDWNKLTAAIVRLKGKKIHIDDTAGIDIDTLFLRSKALARTGKPTLIIIDYLQLIRWAKSSKEYEVVTEVSRRLKEIAKELNCVVIALSQLNRKVEERPKKRPMMSDLRASGAIEQDADVISFLYRDEHYNEDTMDKGVAELITAKFRNGSIGTDYMAAQLQYTTFDNLKLGYSDD